MNIGKAFEKEIYIRLDEHPVSFVCTVKRFLVSSSARINFGDAAGVEPESAEQLQAVRVRRDALGLGTLRIQPTGDFYSPDAS